MERRDNMGRKKKEVEEKPIQVFKVGQKVTFVCFMNEIKTGKIIKRGKQYLIETKDRFYYVDKIQEIISIK